MEEKLKKVKEIPKKWYKRLVEKIKRIIFKHNSFLIIAKQFTLAVIAHGLMVNFMLWSLFGLNFSAVKFIGYGILVYLIKEEFVSFLRRIIFRR